MEVTFMQAIHFETTVKNGYIKLPGRYAGFNNKKVMVGIANKETNSEEKAERVKSVKKFLRKCSGILKDSGLPSDLTIKKIREMRLNEVYGL
jgi:hypothetical protein